MAHSARKKLPSSKRPPSSIDNCPVGQKKRITVQIEQSPGGTKSETLTACETDDSSDVHHTVLERTLSSFDDQPRMRALVSEERDDEQPGDDMHHASLREGGKEGARDPNASVSSRNTPTGQALDEAAAELATVAGYRDSMTVGEKVQLGIHIGHEKKTELEKNAQGSGPMSSTSAEALDFAFAMGGFGPTDRALNIDPKLEPRQVAKTVAVYMEQLKIEPLSDFTFKTPDRDLKLKEERKLLSRQRREREPFVTGASKRIQAASGAWNSNVHRVPGLPAEGRDKGYIMDIEQAVAEGKQPPEGQSFRALMEASKKFGYRVVNARWITFRVPKDLTPMDEFGGSLEPEPRKRQMTMVPEVILRQAQQGGFRLIELEIHEVPWLIMDLEMPLVDVRGKVPEELDPMPGSRLCIAAPTEKVSTMPIPNVGPESREKILRLKFAKDGVPLFLASRKKEFLPPTLRDEREDYFHAADVCGVQEICDSLAEIGVEIPRGGGFWDEFTCAARSDRKKWKVVQENMAMGYCIVDMEIEGPWVNVAGTKTRMLPPPVPVPEIHLSTETKSARTAEL